MSLKLPIYRQDAAGRNIDLGERTSLKNIDEHGRPGSSQELANRTSQPSPPSKRHARFDLDLAANINSACCAQNTIHNVKHSSKLREKKVSISKLKHVLYQYFLPIAKRLLHKFGKTTAPASID